MHDLENAYKIFNLHIKECYWENTLNISTLNQNKEHIIRQSMIPVTSNTAYDMGCKTSAYI